MTLKNFNVYYNLPKTPTSSSSTIGASMTTKANRTPIAEKLE
jgi:hypothetical protein